MLDTTTCSECGASVPRGTRFCGDCGADLVRGAIERDERDHASPRSRRLIFLVALGCCLLVGALALSVAALVSRRSPSGAEQAASKAQADAASSRKAVARLSRNLAVLQAQTAKLAGQVHSTQRTVHAAAEGLTPLANRVLKSVFTIEAGNRFGSGFAAWSEGGDLYVITANHVVSSVTSPSVNVTRNQQSWGGEITETDPANDLAVIRVSGFPRGAAPLWQRPDKTLPRTGDQLLLIGSPYGLEGTVTTGIVSRVTRRLIQTDAAANPGNSGGPALDQKGRIVGILVSGGAENLNFAVPIGRACKKVRKC
jgi:S1-C subfamily serine protease